MPWRVCWFALPFLPLPCQASKGNGFSFRIAQRKGNIFFLASPGHGKKFSQAQPGELGKEIAANKLVQTGASDKRGPWEKKFPLFRQARLARSLPQNIHPLFRPAFLTRRGPGKNISHCPGRPPRRGLAGKSFTPCCDRLRSARAV